MTQGSNNHNLITIETNAHRMQLDPEEISMALFNVRSLSKKTFLINNLIDEEALHCIFLTETWLTDNGSASLIEASPPNYSFSESHRKEKRGGGTASIFKDSLRCTNISLGDFASFEHHAILLKCQPKIIAVTVYRPPKYCPNFYDEFAEFLSILHAQYDKCIISGDFNLHVDDKTDKASVEFMDLLESMDFVQHVSEPTHNRGHTLDLLITKGITTTVKSVRFLTLSDHFCIFFTVNINKLEQRNDRVIRKRYLTPEIADKFRVLMTTVDAKTAKDTASDTNVLVTAFNSKVKTALDSLAPIHLKRVKEKSKAPWINSDLNEQKKACRRAERRWRKTKLHVHLDIFKEQLSTLNKATKKAREDYFSNLIATNANNPRVLFSTIDTLLNPARRTDDSLLSPSKCEEFATHFKDKITNIRAEISHAMPDRHLIVPTPALKDEMSTFKLPDLELLRKIVSKLKTSTCPLDPIPTKFFKENFECMEEDVLALVKHSLLTGIFPSELKIALVKPLLKKNNLDPLVLNNYRPISNLQFLSKVLETTVFKQLNDFLSDNSILDKFQSGFRSHHSTETALVKIVNDLRINSDSKALSILVLLDLSAAFDTIDHDILIERLEKWVGLSGPVLNWIRTYLTNREFYVMLGDNKSENHSMPCGVPQGSILGPLLFSLYMLPLSAIIKKHNIKYHSYADDTQLYMAISSGDQKSIDSLVNCISDLNQWLSQNFLKLNQDKTEVLVIGEKKAREKLSEHLKTVSLSCTNKAKNLGVILDSDLNFEPHFNSIRKASYYHLKNVAKVLPHVNQANKEVVVHAFVTSRLDYCNALFTGLPKKAINQLQTIQNAAARVLTKTKKRAHIKPVLKSLHWLPVSYRIDFKVLLLVYKSLYNRAPEYISDMLKRYTPCRTLRSSGTNLLERQKAKGKRNHGKAAFSYYAPKLWNELPRELRMSESVESFKRGLKTHLFKKACKDYFRE